MKKKSILGALRAILLGGGMLLAAHPVQADNTGTGGTITYTDASGANPAAATQALCDEVHGWKRRLTDRGRAALTPPSVTGAGAAGQRL